MLDGASAQELVGALQRACALDSFSIFPIPKEPSLEAYTLAWGLAFARLEGPWLSPHEIWVSGRPVT